MDPVDSFSNGTELFQDSKNIWQTITDVLNNSGIDLTYVFSAFMIIGATVPYLPQYYKIFSTRNSEGFSHYVCLTLMVANILRVLFWFGKNYEIPLLIQAIIMIFVMFILLELFIRVRNENLINPKKKLYFADFNYKQFWEWTDFVSYVECMIVFTILSGTLFYFLIDVPIVVEAYGLVALVTESLLASPQFIRNFKTRSTEGMSLLMVMAWFVGDLYKTVYFIVRKTPFQFTLCGATQITFDLLIFLQVLIYRKSYKKLPKSRLKHLENRARKRFQDNERTKKLLSIPDSVVATSVYHPQPISKITTETIDALLPNETELVPIQTEVRHELIELDGYDNDTAMLPDTRSKKHVEFRNIDDFEDIDIEDLHE